MNYLWGAMILIGTLYGAITGNFQAVTDQALASAKEAVTLCITMTGILAFWCGIMEIAEKAGIMRGLTKALGPIIGFLFPSIDKRNPARAHIATNMAANLLGLGWAATPAGLEAMKALAKTQTENTAGQKKNVATDAMCDFLIINISSLQLVPVSIIAYRSQYGSTNPSYIVGPAILATAASTGAAVLFIKLRQKLGGMK